MSEFKSADYPFQSNYFSLKEGNMHYIDEGNGLPVLCSHGTPEWSYSYRKVINALKEDHRIIVPDHLGFGLSDKRNIKNFSIEEQSNRLASFIRHMDLRDFMLVGNDFGASIAIGACKQLGIKPKGIVLFNTFCWSLNEEKSIATPAKIMRGFIGRYLYLNRNFSVKFMLPRAFGDKEQLAKIDLKMYSDRFPDKESRRSTFAYVRELLDASTYWNNLAEFMKAEWREIPAELHWGMKDSFFPAQFTDHWKQILPQIQMVKHEGNGHFLQEENPQAIAQALRRLSAMQAVDKD